MSCTSTDNGIASRIALQHDMRETRASAKRGPRRFLRIAEQMVHDETVVEHASATVRADALTPFELLYITEEKLVDYYISELSAIERDEDDKPAMISKTNCRSFLMQLSKIWRDAYPWPHIALAFDLGLVLYWQSTRGLLRVHFPATSLQQPYAFLKTAHGSSVIEPFSKELIAGVIQDLIQV